MSSHSGPGPTARRPARRTRLRLLRLLSCAALSAADAATAPTPTAITLLSGFLGAGKTTCLSHILQQGQGLRLGVVVNDVAKLNIDAALISQEASERDLVRLQNGCACCSISDELTDALTTLGASDRYDHIVVELSGVAEPDLVRDNLKAALAANPLLGVRLEQVVSLVDASTFLSYFDTAAPLHQRSQLRELNADGSTTDACADNKVVSQLLVGQVDAADVLVVNKRDLVSAEELELVRKLLCSLNPDARVEVCERGVLSVARLLGVGSGVGTAESRGEGDAAAAEGEGEGDAAAQARADDHSHTDACGNPACAHPAHEHSHTMHEASRADASKDESCSDPSCNDPSHDHTHGPHAHSHADACSDPSCNDPSHEHTHAPRPTGRSVVDKFGIYSFVYTARRPFDAPRLAALLHQWPLDRRSALEGVRLELGLMPEGGDSESMFSHAHADASPPPPPPPGSPPLRFGIGARVECNVGRWKGGRVTQHWYTEPGLGRVAPYQVLLDDGTFIFAPVDSDACVRAEAATAADASPFVGVLRSKGWCWLNLRPNVAGFWSHAGKHVEVTSAGAWWAAVGEEEMRRRLPEEEYDAAVADFEGEYGDCRQDIVFIGTTRMDEEAIRAALDSCLLSGDEEAEFRRVWAEEVAAGAQVLAGPAGPRARAAAPRMTQGGPAPVVEGRPRPFQRSPVAAVRRGNTGHQR